MIHEPPDLEEATDAELECTVTPDPVGGNP